MTRPAGSQAGPGGIEALTFGCRLNLVETDRMRDLAAEAGLTDLTIVNTCAVTAEAVRQSRQAIRRLGREQPGRMIAVTGCAAEIEPASFRTMPGVHSVVGNARKTDADPWTALASQRDQRATFRPASGRFADQHTRGFLEIQNGCDHRCTFCIIPFGRGVSRSVPQVTIVERARRMVEAGTGEIVLTGVDVTSYGADLPEPLKLGTLVRSLLRAVPDLPRLRLSSIDCIEADPDLLDVIASESRFMPHLHLSLQSGSDLILKRMKRRHSRAEAVAFCENVRRLRPDIVFGADIITGFPTETEAMFADSLALMTDCGLTHLHVFPYSPRPGTPAARMPQVGPEIAKARGARLRQAGAAMLDAHLGRQIGRRLQLLMERGGKGRAPDFTAVRVIDPPPAGSFADVMITGRDGRDLTGTLV